MTRTPERKETNAARQARLRERRKAKGYRRITLWLSPDHVTRLENLGGDRWLGARVKALLDSAVADTARPGQQRALFGTGNPLPDTDRAALWQEADSLITQGLSWAEIARRWNDEGRRTDKGAEYRGPNIAREVKKWKVTWTI